MVDVGDDRVLGRRRGRIDRAPGRRTDHRRRMGRAHGHDRVHDRVRGRARVFRGGTRERRQTSRDRGGRARQRGGCGVRRAATGRESLAARARRRRAACARRAGTYVDHGLDTHDRGTIYVVERGNELDPPIVLSHGVTLSVRTWFHQLEDLPKEGFRTIAFDHRGHGRSVLGDEGHSLENLGRDFKTRARGPRPARRGARRSFDGRRRGAVVRDPVSRRSRPNASPASCCSRRSRTPARLALDPHQGAASRRSRSARPTRSGCGTRRTSASSPRGSGSASNPHPSHVELVRADDGRVPTGDAPRRAARARRTRSHRRAPARADPDARDRRHRRRVDAAVRGPAHGETHSRGPPRVDAGRRAHADARAHGRRSTSSSSTSPARCTAAAARRRHATTGACRAFAVGGVRVGHVTRRRHRRDRAVVPRGFGRLRRSARRRARDAGDRPARSHRARSRASTRSCSRAVPRSAWRRPTA